MYVGVVQVHFGTIQKAFGIQVYFGAVQFHFGTPAFGIVAFGSVLF